MGSWRKILGSGLVAVLAAFSLTGCLQADLHATIMPDASGKIELEFSVHRKSLPFFIKDPLKGLDSPATMRRNTTPGIVAWGEPSFVKEDGWEHLKLTAFFDDINGLRFYRKRDGEAVKTLSFAYDPAAESKIVAYTVDLDRELNEPFPLNKLGDAAGISLDPKLAVKMLPMLRPLLKHLQMQVRLTAPGPLTQVAGLTELNGRTGYHLSDRDAFIAAMTTRAGALIDSDAILGTDPAIAWGEETISQKEIDRFHLEAANAKLWWAKQFPESGR